ncbi:MAG: isoprenyl transferase [Evtepia sp.]|uniref:isoprenyl transferase n=1 Tax=Evtepia sp. TaxID=2773933 RepID=UPI002A749AC5|nr:isoprenyl transferase [Evtepia sp.]MDY3014592.1 isoprenyl transferase [Evtepia sp.]
MAFWHRKNRGRGAGEKPDPARLPRHVAIIMDGNGRWAKKRGLPRTAGHAAGAETFRTIAYYCRDLGIPYLTVYAFSTENWKRPAEEVSTIMDLLRKYLLEALEKMEKDGFRIRFFGDLEPLPPALRELCLEAEQTGSQVTAARHQVNVCLNYGGRDEILRAARAWAQACQTGRESPEELTEAVFSHYLDTAGIPDPDLVIRPSGELRLSNFLPWQSAYAEFYFTDTLWPDFGPAELDKALVDYQRRQRRFGGV